MEVSHSLPRGTNPSGEDSVQAAGPSVDTGPSAGFYAKAAVGDNDRDPAVIGAVTRAKAGDMEAIRFLYVRYKDNVYGYVLSIVRDRHEAEDVTQQVFMKLIASIGKYEPRAVPFTSWILRVSRNQAVDHLRRRRAVPVETVYEAAHAVDDGGERQFGLRDALAALPDDQRQVVVLRHLVGLSPVEIARQLDRTEASVHGLHHRARRALQEQLALNDCRPVVAAAA